MRLPSRPAHSPSGVPAGGDLCRGGHRAEERNRRCQDQVVVARDQSDEPPERESAGVRGVALLLRGKTGVQGRYSPTKLTQASAGIVTVRIPGSVARVAGLAVAGVFRPPVTG